LTGPGIDSAEGEPRHVGLHRNPFVWAFVLGIVTLTALRPLLRHIPAPPPIVGQVPPFTLVDQEGRRFGRDDLLGRVTIANFFCTNCGSATPEVMKGMRRIEDAYKDRGIDRIGLISVSTDPREDTPERLREYALVIGADATRWTFLTGDVRMAHDLAVGLFRNTAPLVAEPRAREVSSTDSAGGDNSKPLVLIDQRGRIRGWYAADEMGLDEVYNRAQHVLAQSVREP
jgi:protein SCO1